MINSFRSVLLATLLDMATYWRPDEILLKYRIPGIRHARYLVRVYISGMSKEEEKNLKLPLLYRENVFEKNMNASKPSEHPLDRGEN